MRLRTVLLLLAVGVCVLAGVSCRTTEKCRSVCTFWDLRTVCGRLKRGNVTSTCTFTNMCMLRIQRCRTNQDWQLLSQFGCPATTNDCRALMMTSQ